MFGYTVAQGLVQVLKASGDNLTRENVMKQAASIKDLELGGLLPGIKVNTSPTDFAPISPVQLQKFKGEAWELFRRDHERRRRRLTIRKSNRPIRGPDSPRRNILRGFSFAAFGWITTLPVPIAPVPS